MKSVKLLLAIVVCGGMMFLATNVVFDLTLGVNTYIRNARYYPCNSSGSFKVAVFQRNQTLGEYKQTPSLCRIASGPGIASGRL